MQLLHGLYWSAHAIRSRVSLVPEPGTFAAIGSLGQDTHLYKNKIPPDVQGGHGHFCGDLQGGHPVYHGKLPVLWSSSISVVVLGKVLSPLLQFCHIRKSETIDINVQQVVALQSVEVIAALR